jgi:protein-disulfide isomerase
MRIISLDRVANVALVIAALTVATVSLRRATAAPPRASSEAESMGPPEYIEQWREIRLDGLALGTANAPIQLLMFSDLECPFCARFHLSTIPALERRYSGKISTTFVHLPIPSHRFALQAATVLECAALQGRGETVLRLVYQKQDSIGLKSWHDFARDAGMPDTAEFRNCALRPAPSRVAAGTRWARKLELSFTPTILLNGWKFRSVPNEETLAAAIDSLLLGRSPSGPL